MSKSNLRKVLEEDEEIELTVIGRESKKESTRPVWFVSKADRILLLPVEGSDTNWYKNVLKNPRLKVSIAGKTIVATAKPVTDKKLVRQAIHLFN